MLQTALEYGFRHTMKYVVRPVLTPYIPIPLQRKLIRQAYRSSMPPRGCTFTRLTLGGVPVLKTSHSKRDQRAILFFHGGAYIIGSPDTHRGLTGHLAKHSAATVYAADYRLAPEHPFPAAIDDAASVYTALLDSGYEAGNIALAGDSAGGGLALALAMKLRDENQPMPGSLTLFSPWVDLTQSQTYSPECEPVLQTSWTDNAAGLYAGKHSRTEAYISPIFGNFEQLPPILVQVGSQEVLLNDAERVAQRSQQAGTDCTLEIYNDLWHVFQVHAGHLNRATDAVITACMHIRKHQSL